jgi:hypothetical protein
MELSQNSGSGSSSEVSVPSLYSPVTNQSQDEDDGYSSEGESIGSTDIMLMAKKRKATWTRNIRKGLVNKGLASTQKPPCPCVIFSFNVLKIILLFS